MKLSSKMQNEIDYAAWHGYQGQLIFTHRSTLRALTARGLVTYDYGLNVAPRRLHPYIPVLTVKGWKSANRDHRPADPGRYSFDEAVNEARLKFGDWF